MRCNHKYLSVIGKTKVVSRIVTCVPTKKEPQLRKWILRLVFSHWRNCIVCDQSICWTKNEKDWRFGGSCYTYEHRRQILPILFWESEKIQRGSFCNCSLSRVLFFRWTFGSMPVPSLTCRLVAMKRKQLLAAFVKHLYICLGASETALSAERRVAAPHVGDRSPSSFLLLVLVAPVVVAPFCSLLLTVLSTWDRCFSSHFGKRVSDTFWDRFVCPNQEKIFETQWR